MTNNISCDKLIRYKKWPVKEGYRNINVCSNSKNFKGLSPFVLGPYIYVCSDDEIKYTKCATLKCNIFENLWQFSKVFEDEDVDEKWFDRRAKGFESFKPTKKVKKNKVKFIYWKGKHYNYFDSRKEIYCRIYSELILKTDDYNKLKKLYDSGTKIQILGFDGYQFNNLEDAFNDLSRPFGHELVLCCLLTNNIFW